MCKKMYHFLKIVRRNNNHMLLIFYLIVGNKVQNKLAILHLFNEINFAPSLKNGKLLIYKYYPQKIKSPIFF